MFQIKGGDVTRLDIMQFENEESYPSTVYNLHCHGVALFMNGFIKQRGIITYFNNISGTILHKLKLFKCFKYSG